MAIMAAARVATVAAMCLFLWLCACSPRGVAAQGGGGGSGGGGPFSPFAYGDTAAAPGLQWFTEAKFGMFMHFGPVSQWGTEISFPLVCRQLPCTVQGPNRTRVQITTIDELRAHREAYAKLATTFNPAEFDADSIADKAAAAGFKYVVYTTIHCDGFANWDSKATSYNIMNTPFGKDLFGLLAKALRARGLKVGAYVCPSLWNANSYWAPDALTALGPMCRPNYTPDQNQTLWSSFTTLLHNLVTELAEQYQPDLFWFDCSNSPPTTDTFLDRVLPTIRKANPNAVVNVRNGLFSDYHETRDQSEELSDSILGVQQMSAGTPYETPAVLQASHQWAYDPTSAQKPASEVLANLILLTAKNGNYLLNVAPDPFGVWPPSALDVLSNLTEWFAVNGEAIHGSRPIYPFQSGGVFFTAKNRSLYILVPKTAPDAEVGMSNPDYARLAAEPSSSLFVGWLRPNLLKTPVATVELLGQGALQFQQTELGLNISVNCPIPLASLRSFYSSHNQDYAPCATRSSGTCSAYTKAGYTLTGAEAACFAGQTPGTVPLGLVFDAANTDNALSSPAFAPASYSAVDLECYVYPDAAAGRVKIDEYWNAERKDYWALASPASRAAATKQGYVFSKTLGYAPSAGEQAQQAKAAQLAGPACGSLAMVFKVGFQAGK